MNLEPQINPKLWSTIESSYQTGQYTNAIKEAMIYLTEVLRDKSGLDGDGESLVGQALGASKGKSPVVRINKYQTETEKTMQEGFQFVLKGMYKLVRNPRSHETVED